MTSQSPTSSAREQFGDPHARKAADLRFLGDLAKGETVRRASLVKAIDALRDVNRMPYVTAQAAERQARRLQRVAWKSRWEIAVTELVRAGMTAIEAGVLDMSEVRAFHALLGDVVRQGRQPGAALAAPQPRRALRYDGEPGGPEVSPSPIRNARHP